MRQKKLLELRQKDPESLFDVADIRAKHKPKRQALQQEKMRQKGQIATQKKKDGDGSARERSGSEQ